MKLINGEYPVDSRIELIQKLTPIALVAVEEELQTEVLRLTEDPYHRDESVQALGDRTNDHFPGEFNDFWNLIQ